MQTVAIIDYGSGNLRSAEKSFQRVVAEADLDMKILVTSNPDEARSVDKIVLPGVGAFGACKHGLEGVSGMIEALEEHTLKAGKPFLGICVGMQLLAAKGLEFGEVAGLGWIPGTVMEITPDDPELKVPHMGWNEVIAKGEHPVLPGNQPETTEDHAYFVHSYHFVPDDESCILAETNHGGRVVAAVGRDNILGVQFHPEKSQSFGLGLIQRFLTWEPS